MKYIAAIGLDLCRKGLRWDDPARENVRIEAGDEVPSALAESAACAWLLEASQIVKAPKGYDKRWATFTEINGCPVLVLGDAPDPVVAPVVADDPAGCPVSDEAEAPGTIAPLEMDEE